MISDVLVSFARATDAKDWSALEDLLVEGAVADLGPSGRREGAEAIVGAIRTLLEGVPATQHQIHGQTTAAQGAGAVVESTFTAYHVGVDGMRFIVGGSYLDHVVRTDAGWRIASRTITPVWTDGDRAVLTG